MLNKNNFYSSFIDKLNQENLIDNKNNKEDLEDIQNSFDTIPSK